MHTNEAKIDIGKEASRMKRRVLGSGLGVLLIIVTVVTIVVVRGISSSSNIDPSLSEKGKNPLCLSTDQGTCQGRVVALSRMLPTETPSPTPTPVPPTPTPT